MAEEADVRFVASLDTSQPDAKINEFFDKAQQLASKKIQATVEVGDSSKALENIKKGLDDIGAAAQKVKTEISKAFANIDEIPEQKVRVDTSSVDKLSLLLAEIRGEVGGVNAEAEVTRSKFESVFRTVKTLSTELGSLRKFKIQVDGSDFNKILGQLREIQRSKSTTSAANTLGGLDNTIDIVREQQSSIPLSGKENQAKLASLVQEEEALVFKREVIARRNLAALKELYTNPPARFQRNTNDADFIFQDLETQIEKYKNSTKLSVAELEAIKARLQRAVDFSALEVNVGPGKPLAPNPVRQRGVDTIAEIDDRISNANTSTEERQRREQDAADQAKKREEERARAVKKVEDAWRRATEAATQYGKALQIQGDSGLDKSDPIEGRLAKQKEARDLTDQLLARGKSEGRAFDEVLKVREAWKAAAAAAQEYKAVLEKNNVETDSQDPIEGPLSRQQAELDQTDKLLAQGKIDGSQVDAALEISDAWRRAQVAAQKYYETLDKNQQTVNPQIDAADPIEGRQEKIKEFIELSKQLLEQGGSEGLTFDEALKSSDLLSKSLRGLIGDSQQWEAVVGSTGVDTYIADLVSAGTAAEGLGQKLGSTAKVAEALDKIFGGLGAINIETTSIDRLDEKISQLRQQANDASFGGKAFRDAFAGIGQLDFAKQVRQLTELSAIQQGTRNAFLNPESLNGFGGAEDPQRALNKIVDSAPKNIGGYTKLISDLTALQDVFRDNKSLADLFRGAIKSASAELKAFRAADEGAEPIKLIDLDRSSNNAISEEINRLRKLASEAEFASEAYEKAFTDIGRIKIAQADRTGFDLGLEQEGRRQYFNEDLGGAQDPLAAIEKIRGDFTKTTEGLSLLENKLKSLQDVFRGNKQVADLLRNALREVREEAAALRAADIGSIAPPAARDFDKSSASNEEFSKRISELRKAANQSDFGSEDFTRNFADAGAAELDQLIRKGKELQAIREGQQELFLSPVSAGGLGGAEDPAAALQRLREATGETRPGLELLQKILKSFDTAFQGNARFANVFSEALKKVNAEIKALATQGPIKVANAFSTDGINERLAEARKDKNSASPSINPKSEFSIAANKEADERQRLAANKTTEAVTLAKTDVDIRGLQNFIQVAPQTERVISSLRAELKELQKDIDFEANPTAYEKVGKEIDALTEKLKKLEQQQAKSRGGGQAVFGSQAFAGEQEAQGRRELANAVTPEEKNTGARRVAEAAAAGAGEAAQNAKALQDAFEAQIQAAKGSGTLEQALEKLRGEFPPTITGLQAFVNYLKQVAANTRLVTDGAGGDQDVIQGAINNAQAQIQSNENTGGRTEQLLDLNVLKRDIKKIPAAFSEGFRNINPETGKRGGLVGGLQSASKVTQGLDEKSRQGISEGLIGGGFPLLFGQGPLAALGGGIGGLLGPALLGGAGGFALSIVGTAVGDALAGIGEGAITTAAALQNPIDKFGELSQAVSIGTKATNSYIENLISSGKRLEAGVAIRDALVENTGFGQEQQRDVGAVYETVAVEFKQLGDILKNVAAVGLLPFVAALGSVLQTINELTTALPRAVDFAFGGQASRDEELRLAKERSQENRELKLEAARLTGSRTSGPADAVNNFLDRRESEDKITELERDRPSLIQRAIAVRLGQVDPNNLTEDQIKSERNKQKLANEERSAGIRKNLNLAKEELTIAKQNAVVQDSGAASAINLLTQRDKFLRNAEELRAESVLYADDEIRNDLTNQSRTEKAKADELEVQAKAQQKLNELKAQELRGLTGLRGNALARQQETQEIERQVQIYKSLTDAKKKDAQQAFINVLREQQSNAEILRRQDEQASASRSGLDAANSIRSFQVADAAANNRLAIARSNLSTGAAEVPQQFNNLLRENAQRIVDAQNNKDRADNELALAKRPALDGEQLQKLQAKAGEAATALEDVKNKAAREATEKGVISPETLQQVDSAQSLFDSLQDRIANPNATVGSPEEILDLEIKAEEAARNLKLAGKDVEASILEGAKKMREQLTQTTLSLVESSDSQLGQQFLSPEIRQQDARALDDEWRAASARLAEVLGERNFRGFTASGPTAESINQQKAAQIRFANEQIKLRSDQANLRNQTALIGSNDALNQSLVAATTAINALVGKDQNVYIQVSPKLEATQIPSGIS